MADKKKQNERRPPAARQYHSFVLRMWLEPGEQQVAAWRYSLEEVAGGRRRGFASLAALLRSLTEISGQQIEATSASRPGQHKK